MMTKETIDRINFLSKKSKAEGLSEEEKEEQIILRRHYIDFIKKQVKNQLECIEIVDDKPNECGCGHKHIHEHSKECGCKKH